MIRGLLFFCGLFFTAIASSLTFPMPKAHDSLVGEIRYIRSKAGDTFSRIARRYDVGYYQLVEANPVLTSDRVLPTGTPVIVPTQFILPPGPRTGIVINLAELRLYYYPQDGRTVETYPVGIGRQGWDTPMGTTKVVSKTKNPTWYAPESIRKARAAEGVELPKIVKPGVDNPLGGYAMYLGLPAYLIHGTNDASGVGRRSSSGCIRMLPEDIENLFAQVTVGTAVRIINDPYKVGWHDNQLYLEAHLPLQEQQEKYGDTSVPMLTLIKGALKERPAIVRWTRADQVASEQSGIPTAIAEATGNWTSTTPAMPNSFHKL